MAGGGPLTEGSAQIVTLVEDRLYYLPNVYELDGRVTTHPVNLRGFASTNSYLLVEKEHALLIDTGFSVHERTLIERVRKLLEPGMRLSVLVIRIGEYYGICNVRPLVEAFDVDVVYGKNAYGNPALAEDFRPEYSPWGTPPGEGWIGDVRGHVIAGNEVIEVSQGRELHAFGAPLRLLPTHWIYDASTKTLFTSDAFTHTWRADPSGPWVVAEVDDSPTFEEARAYMIGNRFWWLPGAQTEPIADRIEEIFREREIERIAPGYGCVLEGKDVVDHHRLLVLEILSATREEPPVPVSVGGRSGGR